MKSYFVSSFRYNAWANKRVVRALVEQSVQTPAILRLAGHLFAAQLIWLHRIKGISPPDIKLWDDYTFEALQELTPSDQGWIDHIEGEEDLSRKVSYNNMAGQPFTSNLDAIMAHVLHHGAYHRGQIALLMRREGFSPVDTDYIIWDREMTHQLSGRA